MEAVLWIVRTGSPWRDLPTHLGNWHTAFGASGIGVKPMFSRGHSTPSPISDMEYAMVDAAIVKAHRHDQGATGGVLQSLCVADCSPAERSFSGHLEEAGNESDLGGGATNLPRAFAARSSQAAGLRRGGYEGRLERSFSRSRSRSQTCGLSFQPRPPPPPPP